MRGRYSYSRMGGETVKQAFVLINSEPGAEATVLKALEAIPEVKEAHMVYGAARALVFL